MSVIAGIIIAAVLSVGGGVSFAAQSSLPGDALYPVKVGVNERVETALAFSPEAKAQVEANIAKTRVDEAATLAAENKLTAGTQDELSASFDAHAENAQSDIETLKGQGKLSAAAGAASDLEAGLGAQAKVLAQLEGKSSTTERVIHPLAVHVGNALDAVSHDREDIETEIENQNASATQTAAQGKIGAAVNAFAEASSFLSIKTAQLGASSTASAEAQLLVASTTIAQAQAQFDAGVYGNAFKLASMALRTAQESKALIKADAELKLNLKNIEVGGDENENASATSEEDRGEGNGHTVGASGTVGVSASSTDDHNSSGTGVNLNSGIHLNLGD